MYKLMLVTDQKEVRDFFNRFSDWNLLGFERPTIFADVQEAKSYLCENHTDAVSYLLPKEQGQDFFTFLSGHREIVCVEPTGDEKRLRRELNTTRRVLLEREEELEVDDVLPMLQNDFYTSLLHGTTYSADELSMRVDMLKIEVVLDAPVSMASLRMPQGDVFLDEVWRYGSERLENALRNIFEREDERIRYVLHVINPHHMRMLGLPKVKLDEFSVRTLTQEHLHLAQEEIKEYFDLDMDIHWLTIFDSLYECSRFSQEKNKSQEA